MIDNHCWIDRTNLFYRLVLKKIYVLRCRPEFRRCNKMHSRINPGIRNPTGATVVHASILFY